MIQISILLLPYLIQKNYEQTEQIFDQIFRHHYCPGYGFPRTGHTEYQFPGTL